MDSQWTNNKISRLIELYKSNTLLWDPTDSDYKFRLKKNETWEAMARELDVSRREIDGKVHMLRSQYAREKKRIAAGLTNDSKWAYFQALSFLPYTPDSARQQPRQNQKAVENSIYFSQSQDAETGSSQSTPTHTSGVYYPPSSSNQGQKDDEFEFYDVTKPSRSRKRPKYDEYDDFDIYGQYIASEMRNTGSEEATLIAKYKINQIILDMRLGRLKIDDLKSEIE